MENKLVFKDGTEVINGFAAKASQDKNLMIQIPGKDIVNATLLLSNPEKTEEIVCYHNITKITYTGFTDLYTIQYFTDENYVEAWLRGENITYKKEYTVPEIYLPEQWRTHNEGAES